ncbi:MAG: DNA repair protein RadC [Candidatus Eisenbacteria bacterium]|nr:DNA repair protein RadC [Candidatus Eisenbacteria bacterium]
MAGSPGVWYFLETPAAGSRLAPVALFHQGVRSFTDLELIAIVLDDGQPQEERLRRAGHLLDGGSAALLRRASARKLRAVVGDSGGARLLASLELGRRAIQGDATKAIACPRHVQEYARVYAAAQKEHFLAVHLNTRHVPTSLEVVSIGTLSTSLVHPREVFRSAISSGTASLILVHNHPSGDPTPSPDDIEITTRLLKVGELVGIEILDHVILAGERYFSFREESLLGS